MHVAITGDSWGYTWIPDGKGGGQTPGIEKILRERGYTITNLAQAGASNTKSISFLSSIKDPIDCVVFIQTEPMREFWLSHGVHKHTDILRPVYDAAQLIAMAQEHGGIVNALQHFLKHNIYSRLVDWSIQHSTPILLVGGCSLIDTGQVPKELTVAVPSWCEMLFDRELFRDHLFQDTGHWLSHEYADLVIKTKDHALMKEWYSITKSVSDKIAFWNNDSKYFTVDKWHPNYAGHEKLANSLEPFFQRYR